MSDYANLSNLYNAQKRLSAYNTSSKKRTDEQKELADINGDGKVNSTDKELIKKAIKDAQQANPLDLNNDEKTDINDWFLVDDEIDLDGDGVVSDEEKAFISEQKTGLIKSSKYTGELDGVYYKNGSAYTGSVKSDNTKTKYSKGVFQYSVTDNNTTKTYPNASGQNIRFKNGEKLVTVKLAVGSNAVINSDGTVEVTLKDGTVQKYSSTGSLITDENTATTSTTATTGSTVTTEGTNTLETSGSTETTELTEEPEAVKIELDNNVETSEDAIKKVEEFEKAVTTTSTSTTSTTTTTGGGLTAEQARELIKKSREANLAYLAQAINQKRTELAQRTEELKEEYEQALSTRTTTSTSTTSTTTSTATRSTTGLTGTTVLTDEQKQELTKITSQLLDLGYKNGAGLASSQVLLLTSSTILNYAQKVKNGEIEDTAGYGDGSALTKEMVSNIMTVMKDENMKTLSFTFTTGTTGSTSVTESDDESIAEAEYQRLTELIQAQDKILDM